MAQVTSPILLDSTGQQIVTKLQTIADNVKPTADEIKMTSSDATTVKAKIDSLNSHMVTKSSGSLHDIKTPGIYWITSAVTDKPEPGAGMYVMQAYSNDYLVGTYIVADTQKQYIVTYASGTWTISQNANLVQRTIEANATLSLTFSAYATYAIFFCGYVESSRGMLVGTCDATSILYKTVSGATDLNITSSGLTISIKNNGQYATQFRMLLFSGTVS